MNYAYLQNGAVAANIPEDDPTFPGIPIADRYSPEFLANCITTDAPAPIGYLYDPETQTFTPPPEPEPDPIDTPPLTPPEQDQLAAVAALAVDNALRLTLLELGGVGNVV